MKQTIRTLAALLAALLLLASSAFALPSAVRSGSLPTPRSAYEEAELLSRYIRLLHIDSGVNDDPLLRAYQALTNTKKTLSANQLRRALIRFFEEDMSRLEALEDAMLDCYDPYSNLFDEEEYRAAYPTSADYTGIGFVYRPCGVFLALDTVYAESPAGRAGLQAGDLIVKVAGHDLRFLDDEERAALMTRYREERFTLTVLRGGALLDFALEPGPVSVPYVEHRILDDRTGYLAISRFEGADFADRLAAAVADLRAEDVRRVVIDLRGNPGGGVEQLLSALNAFVPEKGRLLFTECGRGSRRPHSSTGGGFAADRLCILVDGGSASSSEVFTGVLSDLGLATVIGSETYGKGRGQSGFFFGDGILMLSVSAVELPVTGRYDGQGLKPDIAADGFAPLAELSAFEPLPSSAVSSASDSASVLALEQRLHLLGFLAGEPDGVFDAATEAALAELYRGMGVSVQKTASVRLLRTLDALTRRMEDARIRTDAALDAALAWLFERSAA